MHIDQAIYRELYHEILREDANPYEKIVRPWLFSEQVEQEKQWLAAFAARPDEPYPEATVEDLWRLYALSRVNDVMLLSFQPAPPNSPTDYEGGGHKLNFVLDQYVHFMTTLGLARKELPSFHPFFHEIVSVETTVDDDHPIEITETLWPCFMLGNMMFSRAGVSVRGGRNHIRKEIAERSTIYWTYWRRYRPSNDLSHGWGSNSQWRTSFRRDYEDANEYFYNVDPEIQGIVDLNNPNIKFTKPEAPITPASSGIDQISAQMNGVTREQRIEFVRHRCFIKTDIGDNDRYDLWPYDDFYSEPKNL